MKKGLIILFVLFFSINTWASDNKDKLMRAFDVLAKGDDGQAISSETVFQIFSDVYLSTDSSKRKRKREEHKIAEYGLAICFYKGFGIKQNYSAAISHFKSLTIEVGLRIDSDYYAELQYFRYCMFGTRAIGIRRNDYIIPFHECYLWSDAHFFLGECYYYGLGTDRNPERAISEYSWSKFSSSQAIINTGILLLDGFGEKWSETYKSEIFRSIEVEANNDNTDAQYILGHLCLEGIGCPQDTLIAISNFEKSANKGKAEAMYKLVHDFYKPYDSKYKDDDKAFMYTTMLAIIGNSYSQYDLGLYYDKGIGTEKNEDVAFYWFEKAAGGGCPDAILVMGDMYYNGVNVQKDDNKALTYYLNYLQHQFDKNPLDNTIVIRLNFVESKIGDIYYEGQNYNKAVKYYQKAANANQITAKSAKNFALCHKWGYGGLTPSDKKCEEWLQKAAQLGSEDALEILSN